ncbi:hypothetical protein [Thermoflexus sp.]|uniref:hypothetical protein n=1 Tax=Thermoflexus sp. TaxID=1969742 RepID=UPI002ADE124A|nr:hypothetical protein [Thermoflexus sp.]
MRDALKIRGGIVVGVLALIGLCAVCSLAVSFGLFAGLIGSLQTPTPVGIIPPAVGTPTPSTNPMGTSVRVDSLRITPLEYRFGEAYRTRWGSRGEPPAGAKFLWVRIMVENMGENAVEAPFPSAFLIRHKGVDIRADVLFGSAPSDMASYEGGLI